jgi:hypothetical protein
MTRSFSLSLTKSFPSNKKTTTPIFSALEKQIDVVVYKVYGLTYEEVKIIEPEFAMSVVEYGAFRVK